MTTVLFTRHGQTDWNVQMLRQGHTDIPLNETGREQALSCGRLIDIPVDVICASHLCRARETAEIIARQIGFTGPIQLVDGLMERSFGSCEGTRVGVVAEEVFWQVNSPFNQGRTDMDAETLPALFQRVDDCLDRLCAAYAGKTILLVSHGGVAVAVRRYFDGEPADGDYLPLIPPNTCLLRYQTR